MADISYIQLEQGIKILELQAELDAEKEAVIALMGRIQNQDDLKSQISSLEAMLEGQRVELLAAQRTAQLANSTLEKAQREIPLLKEKLAISDRERKALKGLNPEKLKKNLIVRIPTQAEH